MNVEQPDSLYRLSNPAGSVQEKKMTIKAPEPQCPDKQQNGYCRLNDRPCIKDFAGVVCEYYEQYLAEVNGELLRE